MNQGPDQTPAPTAGGGPPQATTSTGLEPNVGGALAYLLGVFTGILFLVIEKKSPFVRFHAGQSIGIFVVFFAVWVVLAVVGVVLGAIPVINIIAGIIGLLLSLVMGLGGLVLWLFLMYKAYQGEEWEFPWIGREVRKILSR